MSVLVGFKNNYIGYGTVVCIVKNNKRKKMDYVNLVLYNGIDNDDDDVAIVDRERVNYLKKRYKNLVAHYMLVSLIMLVVVTLYTYDKVKGKC